MLSSTGNDVFESVVDQVVDVLNVLVSFKTITNDRDGLIEFLCRVQRPDDLDIVGRGGLQVDLVL